jgi:hypothetical protein
VLVDPQKLTFGPESTPPALPQKPTKPGGGGGGGGSGTPRVPNSESEAAAIKVAQRYALEKLGAVKVNDVQKDNLGWDLEFVYEGGSKDLVEVKGSTGEAAFVITSNERQASMENGNFYLYYVCNLASGSKHSLLVFDNIGPHLQKELLDPLSWQVKWKEIPHKRIELSED